MLAIYFAAHIIGQRFYFWWNKFGLRLVPSKCNTMQG